MPFIQKRKNGRERSRAIFGVARQEVGELGLLA